MTIVLGHRLIGKEKADAAAKALTDGQGGGSIQLGHRLNKKGAPTAAKAPAPVVAAAPAPAKIAAPAIAADPKAPETPAPQLVDPSGMSEEKIEDLLTDYPDGWEEIMKVESQRAEGPRPRVARMLLVAGDMAETHPIPPDIKSLLMQVAGDAFAEDVAALEAAVPVEKKK